MCAQASFAVVVAHPSSLISVVIRHPSGREKEKKSNRNKGEAHTVFLTFERAEAAEQRLLGAAAPRLNVERELYFCRANFFLAD